ncbi:MAG: hypothetical protein DRP01_01675 [Archaeoglobales archaeon]|nr:MAG: hypothetical protein DRP01_01675 [Archaeoglobales archaeon]
MSLEGIAEILGNVAPSVAQIVKSYLEIKKNDPKGLDILLLSMMVDRLNQTTECLEKIKKGIDEMRNHLSEVSDGVKRANEGILILLKRTEKL